MVGRVYEHEGEVDALLDEVERDILRISEERVEAQIAPTSRISSTTPSTPSRITISARACSTGMGTGFADFDKMTDGLHGGEMIVIAARPSMGKTSLAMNIAEHVAIDQKLPVGSSAWK